MEDISESTALGRADWNWELAICHLGGPSRPRSLADLTAQFNRHVWPSRAEPKTRAKNWRYWSCAVSWAIARKAVRLLLPMSTDTLKALTWDLITHAASVSLVEAVWHGRHAIKARHRQYHLKQPIDGRGELTAWKHSIASVTGRPLSLKLHIHRTIVVRLLAWRPTQVAWNRARLAMALAAFVSQKWRICRLATSGSITSQAVASRAMKGHVQCTSISVRTIGSGAVITRRWGGQRTRSLILFISCVFGWRRWT